MYNRSWEDSRQEKIENKIKETMIGKQKAIDKRVKELQKEKFTDRAVTENIGKMKGELQEFRGKMKDLYKIIFQGSKELSIRKNDLIHQIQGNDL